MNFLEIPAVEKLLSLNLPCTDFVIAGTGIMFALGIRKLEDFTDLDLQAVGDAWKILELNAESIDYDDEWETNHVVLYNGEIEAYQKFGPIGFDYLKAKDTSVTIFGLNFWNLDTLLEWKTLHNKPKDIHHIELIRNYLRSTENS